MITKGTHDPIQAKIPKHIHLPQTKKEYRGSNKDDFSEDVIAREPGTTTEAQIPKGAKRSNAEHNGTTKTSDCMRNK